MYFTGLLVGVLWIQCGHLFARILNCRSRWVFFFLIPFHSFSLSLLEWHVFAENGSRYICSCWKPARNSDSSISLSFSFSFLFYSSLTFYLHLCVYVNRQAVIAIAQNVSFLSLLVFVVVVVYYLALFFFSSRAFWGKALLPWLSLFFSFFFKPNCFL